MKSCTHQDGLPKEGGVQTVINRIVPQPRPEDLEVQKRGELQKAGKRYMKSTQQVQYSSIK